jgi:transposase
MKPRRVYEASFKANVIVQHLKGHQSIEELAERYQIHPNQIKNWRSVLFRRAGEIFEDKRRKRQGRNLSHRVGAEPG